MINTKRNTNETASWNTQKTKLKTAFPSITDEDLNYDFGKKSEMLEKLSKKLNKTSPELVAVLEKQ